MGKKALIGLPTAKRCAEEGRIQIPKAPRGGGEFTKKTFAILTAVVLAGLVVGVPAWAGLTFASSGEDLFRSDLVGSSPDVTIRGVASGGVPWVVEGEARLDEEGRLRVDIEGLLIVGTGGPLDGTTGPVTGVFASLTCATGPAVNTQTVPLDADGDAEIDEDVSLPAPCFGPIILIRVGQIFGTTDVQGPWIAASGFA